MNVKFFFALLFISLTTFAQNNLGKITGYDFSTYDPSFRQIQSQSDRAKFYSEHKIAGVTTTRRTKKTISTKVVNYNKEGQPINETYSSNDGVKYTEVRTYDEKGNLTSIVRKNKKDEIIYSVNNTYDEQDRRIKKISTTKKGTSMVLNNYDSNGNLIYKYECSTKSKITLRKMKFDENKNILLHELYEKDTLEPIKKLVYHYYENGTKKSIEYFEKNKLVYTWSFDCKEEGEIVLDKKSDSSYLCIKTEYDKNGNVITWRHEFHSKGFPVKIKSVIDSSGFRKETIMYLPDETIYNHTIFFKDGGFLSANYNEKGVITGIDETYYNSAGKLIKQVHESKEKPKYNKYIWYAYENDLLTLKTEINRFGTSVEEYQYTFFE